MGEQRNGWRVPSSNPSIVSIFYSSAQLSLHFSSAHYPPRVIYFSFLPTFPGILVSLCFSVLVCCKLTIHANRDTYSHIHGTNARCRRAKHYEEFPGKQYFGILGYARQVCEQVPSVSETFLLTEVLLSDQPQLHKTNYDCHSLCLTFRLPHHRQSDKPTRRHTIAESEMLISQPHHPRSEIKLETLSHPLRLSHKLPWRRKY